MRLLYWMGLIGKASMWPGLKTRARQRENESRGGGELPEFTFPLLLIVFHTTIKCRQRRGDERKQISWIHGSFTGGGLCTLLYVLPGSPTTKLTSLVFILQNHQCHRVVALHCKNCKLTVFQDDSVFGRFILACAVKPDGFLVGRTPKSTTSTWWVLLTLGGYLLNGQSVSTLKICHLLGYRRARK